jgi:hypothetical protein
LITLTILSDEYRSLSSLCTRKWHPTKCKEYRICTSIIRSSQN